MRILIFLILIALSSTAFCDDLKEFAEVKSKAYWDKFYEDGYEQINDIYRYYLPYIFEKKIDEFPRERIIEKENFSSFCKKYLSQEKTCPLPLKLTKRKDVAFLLFELREKPEKDSKATGYKIFELHDHSQAKNISRFSPTGFSFIIANGKIVTPTSIIQDTGIQDEGTNWDDLNKKDRSWVYENILDYKFIKKENAINEEWMRFSSMGNKLNFWLSSEDFKYFRRPGLGTKSKVNWNSTNLGIQGLYSLHDVRFFRDIYAENPLCFLGIQNGEILSKKFFIEPLKPGFRKQKEYEEKISSLQLFFQDIRKYNDQVFKFSMLRALETGKWNPSLISFQLDKNGFEKPPEEERNCEGPRFVRDMPADEKLKFFKKYCSILFPKYCSDFQIKNGIQTEHFKRVISEEEMNPMEVLKNMDE